MKTISIDLYSFTELSGEARLHVIENIRYERENDPELLESISREMLGSLKAVCAACGLNLLDWSFGPGHRKWKARVSSWAEDSGGNRAKAWFLRILMRHGYERPRKFAEMRFPGVCGFTGVCYDDTVAETVWKALLDHATVDSAFHQVAREFCRLLEIECDFLMSDEGILGALDLSAEIYTKEGVEF